MRKPFTPLVEHLEPHTLLSALAPISTLGPHAEVAASTLKTSITTDKAVYQVGQPVHLALSITNTGTRTVTFVDGPSVDGFVISTGGKAIWQSNAGAQPMFLRLVTLAPGASFTLHATWDGQQNTSSHSTGTFTARNPLTGSASVSFAIQPSVASSPLSLSISTGRPSYSVGQTVVITLTETNTSRHDVPVMMGAQILSGSITGVNGPVWVFRDMMMGPTYRGVLHPGQTRKLTLVWDGAANIPGTPVLPGVLRIRAGVDGLSASVAVPISAA